MIILIVRRRLNWLLPLLIFAWPVNAHAARFDAWFGEWFDIKKENVLEARGYTLTGIRAYNKIVVGRYKSNQPNKAIRAGIVLLNCKNDRCQGNRIWLPQAGRLRLFHIVDLRGKPGFLMHHKHSIPNQRGRYSYQPLPGRSRHLRWPALVIETHYKPEDSTPPSRPSRIRSIRTTRESVSNIIIISLRKAERQSPRIFTQESKRTNSDFSGHSTSFKLVKGAPKLPLDIMGTRQRSQSSRSRCQRPEPTKHRFRFDKNNHYVELRKHRETSDCY